MTFYGQLFTLLDKGSRRRSAVAWSPESLTNTNIVLPIDGKIHDQSDRNSKDHSKKHKDYTDNTADIASTSLGTHCFRLTDFDNFYWHVCK